MLVFKVKLNENEYILFQVMILFMDLVLVLINANNPDLN